MNSGQKETLHRGLRLLGNKNAILWSNVNAQLHALMIDAIRNRTDSVDLITIRFIGINLSLYHDRGEI